MVSMEELLYLAAEKKASDLHLFAGASPKVRVGGKLMELDFPSLGQKEINGLLLPLLRPGNQVPESMGEFEFSCSIPEFGRIRVHIFRQNGSNAAVLRLLGTGIPTLEQLGLPEAVKELTQKRHGLILVTGASGSGKTTTLASLIDRINETRKVHILTVEQPVEYQYDPKCAEISQREIGRDTPGYPQALQAALHQDIDVLLAGKVPDSETVSGILTAAETGHLVFASFDTPKASAAIDCIVDMFEPHKQQLVRERLASVLEAVVFEQLIPAADKEERIAAFEVLLATETAKRRIRDNKNYQLDSLMQENKEFGMCPMDDAIYELYLKRRICREDALDFAMDPESLRRKISF